MKDVDVAPIAGAPTGDANPSVGSTLLERLRAGQTDAWERLARLYGPTVYVWCRRAGVPEADAADVSQEVLAAVARHLADFRRERPGDSFRGWLWTITRNKVRDHWRRHVDQVQASGGTTAQEVGAMVGQNPLSILVACHRVVGADGKLVGYAGGLRRKRFLLYLERDVVERPGRLF